MACNCKSYNAPQLGGDLPEVVLPYRKYFPLSPRETVCVDACISEMIERLWANGIDTAACCCGHNGRAPIANGRPNVIISNPTDAAKTAEILSEDTREWFVLFWAGGRTP